MADKNKKQSSAKKVSLTVDPKARKKVAQAAATLSKHAAAVVKIPS
jgi:hypothetical protein